MKRTDEQEHKLLALWAADCAEHVLPSFESKYPEDTRPRKAIEAARAWVHQGLKMTEARTFALAAHAAARDAEDYKAKSAARAAGHAAATAHVASHAQYAAAYALKASMNPVLEQDWQLQCLPEKIKSIVHSDNK